MENPKKTDPKIYPEGHFIGKWMGIGIALFSGVGVALSVSTGNPGLIGIGPAIGVAFGLSVGQAVESKHKKEGRIRPLTSKEKRTRQLILVIGVVLLLLGIAVFWLLL